MEELNCVIIDAIGPGETTVEEIEKNSLYKRNLAFIERCFHPDTLEEIVDNLKRFMN